MKDDAGGGLRGLRPTLSPDIYKVLSEGYGLGELEDARDLGGSSSLNILLVAHGTSYVGRVYRPHVSTGRLSQIQVARVALAKDTIPSSQTLSTTNGDFFVACGQGLLEVETFVEHDAYMNSWERLESGMVYLGRVHSVLRRLTFSAEGKAPLFANHVESRDALEWTARGCARIRSWPQDPKHQLLADKSEDLASRVAEIEADIIDQLPRQVVHGDFWDNNVFFRASKVVLVADLDFMGERARIDDLALTLWFAHLEFSHADATETHLAKLQTLIDAYDSGLDVPLTTQERAALPGAIARQPLWAVGRWMSILDDELQAQALAGVLGSEVDSALAIVNDLDRWRDAFA